MQPSTTPRRWSRLGLLGTIAAAGLIGAVTVSPPPAGADLSSFTALSAAEGIRVSPYAGGAPVANEPVELGVPVAQATYDSLGTSQSFSSAVYPGDLLVSLPGLIAGVSGGQLNLPNYPMIAISDQETAPDKEVAGPGVSMRATSDANGARATTTLGTLTTTVSSGREPDGSVVSESESVIIGLATDLLKIGNLRSTARVVLKEDGTIERASTFEVSGLEVAGMKVALTRDGFVFGDQKAPPPGAEDLESALAQAGVDLRLLGTVETPDSIDGQGLEIVISREIGGAVTPVRLRLRFGRVAASVGRTDDGLVAAPLPPPDAQGAPAGSPSAPPEPAGSPGPTPVAVEPSPSATVPDVPRLVPTRTSSAVVSRLPVLLPDVSPATPLPSPVIAPAPVPPAGDVPAPAADEPESQAGPIRLASTQTSPFDARDVYLVLAAVAGMAGAGVFLVARFGVRI